MKGAINIQFDTESGQVLVGAVMTTQEEKNMSVGVLLSAIKLILDYKASAILTPAGMGGNGAPRPALDILK
jgi:hypothetical protein